MEPKGLLPFSQASAACPYPEPDQSALCLPIARGPFFSGLPTKVLYAPNDSNGMLSIMAVHLTVQDCFS
jgi:hypothetical protein